MIRSPEIFKPEERAAFALRSLYRSYGYSQFRMNKFEEYDFYSRNKDFLVSDSVITFTDANGKLMALKPDVTLSVIKNGADDPEGLRKVYYNKNVYRIPKGAKAFREIMQAGLECIGRVDEGCLAEVLALALKSLEIFGEPFVLEVSSLDVLSAFIAKAACGRVSERELIEMAGSKNVHGISELLRGSGVCAEAGKPLLDLLGLPGFPGLLRVALFGFSGKLVGIILGHKLRVLELLFRKLPVLGRQRGVGQQREEHHESQKQGQQAFGHSRIPPEIV